MYLNTLIIQGVPEWSLQPSAADSRDHINSWIKENMSKSLLGTPCIFIEI